MSTDCVYIKHLSYQHSGPVDSLELDADFHEDGNPKPLVFVGSNGSGKSTVLSAILDSMYEIAEKAYSDACETEGRGYQYFKAIAPQEISIGKAFQTIRIDYTNSRSFLFKTGNLEFEEYKKQTGFADDSLDWRKEQNSKANSFTKEESEHMFSSQVICGFLSNRHEKPSWMGELYYRQHEYIGPSVRPRFAGKLENRIIVEECISDTLEWLLNIITDSRADINAVEGSLRIIHTPNIESTLSFGSARKNIEALLSKILGEDIYFDLGYRNAGSSRFSIKHQSTDAVICPSLDSLSTGQIILFELFSTIVRYAENNDLGSSVDVSSIGGIIIVDEIDLHLHSSLQRTVLPELIRMFPKVQFIFTTHSPLLLLGLEENLGANGYTLIELPSGNSIDPESFKEFDVAYNAIANSKRYMNKIREYIESNHTVPLVVTEGTTDWRILKAAKEKLIVNRPELFQRDFRFLEFSSKEDAECSCEMGSKQLKTMCMTLSHMPASTHGVTIAIFDRDEDDIVKKMDSSPFKSFSNDVYSFAIPVPAHREDSPEISIEQLLTDSTMKSKISGPDGIERRLYTSDEFDQHGRCIADSGLFVRDGSRHKSHIKVIDGGTTKVLRCTADDQKNYALSKIAFADAIFSGDIELTKQDLKSFVPIFETIQRIIEIALQNE